jgi:hypothetical protein
MYTHTLKTDLNDLIANRLGDLNKVYWTNDEINLLIDECLLTLGSLGQFWKDKLFLKTEVDKNDYNLYTDLSTDNDSVNKVRLDKTYQDVLNLINIYLMENISDANLTSELYELSNILKYIDKRLDLFLLKTGLNVDIHEQDFQSTQIYNELPDYLLDIIRVSFKDTNENSNKFYKLFEEDEGSLESFKYNYNLEQTEFPKYFTRVLHSDNVIRVYYGANNGTLRIIGIIGRNKAEQLTTGSTLLLPPNLIPYLKWGVLADLLSEDGHGQDLSRAEYCKQRWEEGIIVGKNYTSVLKAFTNNQSINIESITDIDDFDNEWENRLQPNDTDGNPIGYPNTLIMCNNNLMFLNMFPLEIYDISFDSVINAPITSDYIEVREEYITILVDYIYHLAKFKEGFSEVQSSQMGLQKFMELALLHNSRLIKEGITVETLMKLTKREEEVNNRGV